MEKFGWLLITILTPTPVDVLPIPGDTADINPDELYGRDVEDFKYIVTSLRLMRQTGRGDSQKTQLTGDNQDTSRGMVDDIILTRQAVDQMLRRYGLNDRVKRNVINFDTYRTYKWPMPIPYFMNETTVENELHREMINRSLAEWASKTCVRFQALQSTAGVTSQYLYFQSNTPSCSTYVGSISTSQVFPQVVNLNADGCFIYLGTPIHEIGHVLGLEHEHARPDRDDYVDIDFDNINNGRASNFDKTLAGQFVYDSTPYAYSSVMHYDALSFSKDKASGLKTIVPKNPDYLAVIGQKSQLDFYDAKAINVAYCSDVCTESLPCEHGGYPDVHNCSQCSCRDEWSGIYCTELTPSSQGCSPDVDHIELDISHLGQVFQLHSPSTTAFGNFVPGDKCFWHIKAPNDTSINLWFGERFGLHWQDLACVFWVEIKIPDEQQGVRYCGYYSGLPPFANYSQGNDVLVIFQSFQGIYHVPYSDSGQYTAGFTLHYELVSSTPDLTSTDETTPVVSVTSSGPEFSTQESSVMTTLIAREWTVETMHSTGTSVCFSATNLIFIVWSTVAHV